MLKAIASDSLSTALGQLLQRENFWLSCCVVSDMSNCLQLHPDPHRPERPQADTRRVVSDSASPAFALARSGMTRLRRDLCVLARTI
jgi:hypothetical protein